MAKEFSTILAEAQQIKLETIEKANTASRTGTCLEDIVVRAQADNAQFTPIDNLTNTSAINPLSANQGKVLNDKVVQVETDLNQLAGNFNAFYKGLALPSTNPGTPDSPSFYIASQPGVYSNFGGATIKYGESAILYNSGGAGSVWTKSTVFKHDFILREQVPMFYKAANFDIYITGKNLIIKSQLQYGESFFLGVPDVTTTIDLTSSANWMGGVSPSDYMFLYLKSGGTVNGGSEIKLGSYIQFASYTDYIPVASISLESPVYYLNNVVGYTLKNRKYLPHILPFVFSDKFKTSISGSILTLTEQLQYQGGHFMGIIGGSIDIDLSNVANWIEGTVSPYAYLMVKNDGEALNPSTLKLVTYERYYIDPDYIPAIALKRTGTKWEVTNIMGYTEEGKLEVINTYDNEITEHDGVLTIVVGLINQDGSIDLASTIHKSATPIAVSDDNPWIVFKGSNSGKAPNYVNCYTNNDFTGFLGRSDSLEYLSLTLGAELDKPLKLASGTKFISFLTESPATNSSGNTLTNIELISVNGFDRSSISYNGTEHLLINPMKFSQNAFSPYQVSPIRFQVPVNCNIADYLSNSTNLQDESEIYNDWGMLMLPESYSPTGKPTRLIIGCHGAGGSVSSSQSQTENTTMYKYFCANGFAVMDMNGLPEEYATLMSIDYYNNIGSPIAVQSYIKGVQWVLENYNIDKDGILINGGSMGGISSSNIVLSGYLNIIAHGINCPVLDTYNHIWLNPWSGGLPKTAMIKIYGFVETTPGSGVYVYDEEKLKGFNPILNSMISFDKVSKLFSNNIEVTTTNALTNLDEVKRYPCPIKIWHSTDDPTVNFAVSQRHINSIRKGGQIAYLRSIPSGGHAPLEAGTTLTSPSGSTNYKGSTLSIKPIVEEVYLWFKRFNN